MLDVEKQEENEVFDSQFLETGLPGYLADSLKRYKEALVKIRNKEKYYRIDCDFCDLQADINCAEVDQEISSRQADYLRRTYLYDE